MSETAHVATSADVRQLSRFYYGVDEASADWPQIARVQFESFDNLADALDALRAAVNGCGKPVWPDADSRCGGAYDNSVPGYRDLCDDCDNAKWTAIVRLVP